MIMRTPSMAQAGVTALLLSTTPTLAQISPTEVWDNWQENLTVYGQDAVVIGGEVLSGDTLTLTDITITTGDAASVVTVTIPQLVLSGNADGTVGISISSEMPLEMVMTPPDGPPSTATGAVRHTDLTGVVSGTADNITYEVSAASYGLHIDEISGSMAPEVEADITLYSMIGRYRDAQTPQGSDIGYELSGTSLVVQLGVDIPALGFESTIFGQIDGFLAGFEMIRPDGFDMATVQSGADLEGFYFEGGIRYDTFLTRYMVDDGRTQHEGVIGMSEAGFASILSLPDTGLTIFAQDPGFQLTTSQQEQPLELSAEALRFAATGPLGMQDEPGAFGLSLTLDGFEGNNIFWRSMDPGMLLPRDPITVDLSLRGQGRWLIDLLDPAQRAGLEMANSSPIAFETFSLETVEVSAVGATLSARGDFDIDPDGAFVVPGIGLPVGQVTARATGISSLLATLVNMGVIPESTIMQAQLFMGMFARSTGDDAIETSLEVTNSGNIFINGQQVQ